MKKHISNNNENESLLKIAQNIEKREDGIYFSKKTSKVSYPEQGNEHYLDIEQNSFWFKHRNRIIIESVKKHSPDKVFYDVGGGNGFVSMGLENAGIQTVLVEPGMQGAKNAQKRGLKNIICSTLEDAGFIPDSIPSMGLFDVVEHIEDDEQFLRYISLYLKKKGLVYITVPAFQVLWSDEDVDAGHFKRYTLKNLELICKKSGLDIVYSTYIFSILPVPVFLFRTIPSKLKLNKNKNPLEKQRKEHDPSNGFVGAVLDRIWSWELNKINKNQKIPFGGSCFVVARKA